jgi:pimeloyl-ACP methyl ester carboxylesterase
MRFRSILLWLTVAAAGLSQAGCSLNRDESRSGIASAYIRGEKFTVYSHHPEGCEDPMIMLIFSGAARKAQAAIDGAVDFANRHCLVLYAPLLDKKRFPIWSYQEGGVVRRERYRDRRDWTVWLAKDFVAWAREREGRSDAPYILFGHSAGGQFLSRVAAFALPDDAHRIVIANPSTYVLPSVDETAPYGFGGLFLTDEGERQIRQYLRMPVTIFLGESDVGSKMLVNSLVARRQGDNRFDRGLRTYHFARQVAAARGWSFCWKVVTVKKVGHSASALLKASEADEAFALGQDFQLADGCGRLGELRELA